MRGLKAYAVIFFLLFSFTICNLPTVKADFQTSLPTAGDGVAVSLFTVPPHGGTKYYAQPDSYAIRNPVYDYTYCSFYTSHTAFLMNWDFTIENKWSNPFPPIDDLNITITDVQVVLLSSSVPRNAGYFSFCIDYPTNDDPPVTYAKQYGSWIDSPLYPYRKASFGAPHIDYWNITSYRDWQISELLSDYSFRIMWTFTNNQTAQEFDYLGVRYFYEYGENIVEEPTGDTSYRDNINLMIWLLIIYFPALLMVQYAPVIGYAGGIILMMIVVTATQPTFFPITLLGIASVAVMLYKEGVR